MSANPIDQAPVPVELSDTAIGLVWTAQALLCDVDALVRDVVRLEGAIELLRPHVDGMVDDDIADRWHRDGGVQILRTLLCQMSAVIEHHTGWSRSSNDHRRSRGLLMQRGPRTFHSCASSRPSGSGRHAV
jgi:hypothetical protein